MRIAPSYAMALAVAMLVSPALVRADDKIPAGASIDFLVRVLLTHRDDDTREEAAERLGRVGGLSALESLDYAAVYDDDRSVRKDAKKAAEQIRERLAVAEATPVAPMTPPPPPAPVYAPPPVVVAPARVYVPPVVYAPPPVVVTRPVIISRPVYYYRPICGPVFYGHHHRFHGSSLHFSFGW